MRANRVVIEAAAARGRRLGIIDVPQTAFSEVADGEIEVSYLNYYVASGGVVVPVAGLAQDEDALALIATAYPGRKVVGVRVLALAFGGGGVHCITQQIPAARTASPTATAG
ncbi:agmatine deiminase family protein [Streptomyces sp. NPDC058701]|uniref:agmatine deiminase family protein n=1 Tax=Streptomyces sp. NPDC058701 TaxID=3346608 RepID=UPI00364E72A5